MSTEAEVVQTIGDFCTNLRMHNGIDEVQVVALRALLRKLAAEWEGQQLVPRDVSGMLSELAPTVDAVSYAYADTEGAHLRELAAELALDVAAVLSHDAQIHGSGGYADFYGGL